MSVCECVLQPGSNDSIAEQCSSLWLLKSYTSVSCILHAVKKIFIPKY